MTPWSKKYAKFVINWRLPLLATFIVAIITGSYFIKDITILNDPDTFLPQHNRYVLTNTYGEQKFGLGNLMVVGLMLKKCQGGVGIYEGIDKINSELTQKKCEKSGGHWVDNEDIYQSWFINLAKDLHYQMQALPYSRPQNFIDIASQKVKYMGLSEQKDLEFSRLIPVDDLSDVPIVLNKQLNHLKQGLESNPVLAPMLLLKEDKYGNRCKFLQKNCQAKGLFFISDYSDDVKENYLPWIEKFNTIITGVKKKYGDKVEVRIAGEPYFLSSMLYDLKNKWWLFVISLLIIILTLRYFNKHWSGAVLALICVIASLIFTLGLMGWTQYKLTTMMILTPLLILAIGTGHAVQVYRRYLLFLYDKKMSNTPLQAAEKAIDKTIKPATIAIVTDMVGFFSLSFVDISFYKAYAYFGMFGMFSLLLTTTTLLPIIAAMLTPEHTKNYKRMNNLFNRDQKLGKQLAKILLSKWRLVPIGLLILLLAWSTYYTQIFSSTFKNFMPGVQTGIHYSRAAFKYDTPINADLRRLNEVMPGVISVNIPISGIEPILAPCLRNIEMPKGVKCWDEEKKLAQGIFNNPEVLAAINETEEWMRAHPYIGFTASYVQYAKMVNMLIMTPEGEPANLDLFAVPTKEFIEKNLDFYGDPNDKSYIPDPKEIVVAFNGLLESVSSGGDLDSFISHDWNEGMLMGFINTMHPEKTAKIIKDLQDFLQKNQDRPGFNLIKWGYKSNDIVNLPDGRKVQIENTNTNTSSFGGFLGVTQATHDIAKKEWIAQPLLTILFIFIITLLIFRTPIIASILSSLLLIILFAQYGLGGYFTSIENWSGNLHFGTLVSLSIAVGVGVDYGIYMIFRLKEEINRYKDWSIALEQTLAATGSAIIISMLVLVASFIPLLLTNLANTWALGIYISGGLIINMLLSITILPIIINKIRPAYIFEKVHAVT